MKENIENSKEELKTKYNKIAECHGERVCYI